MDTAAGRIRAARLADIGAMQAIERAAGRLFAGIGMEDIAADPPLEHDVLASYVRGRRAWIAEVDGQPQGYALADIVDDHGHLAQISVHPAFGRRGLGRALIRAVIAWAQETRLPALTLLTFRDVPWNGPYYAAMGFQPLPDTSLTPELRALRDHESDLGLDRDARVAMCLNLTAADDPTT